VVPLLRIVQLFVKLCPAAIVVPSRIVSLTKVAVSVAPQVFGAVADCVADPVDPLLLRARTE
jgi:hypothetical protein